MNCKHTWVPSPNPDIHCGTCYLPLYVYLEDLEFRLEQLEKLTDKIDSRTAGLNMIGDSAW